MDVRGGLEMNGESNLTLTIREIGTAAQRTFMFNILLDGEVIISNQNLSPAESQAVRDFSRRYSILFEQRTRQPRITSDNLKALGMELFKLWLAQSWSKITKNVPVGTLRSLVIASDVADILNLPWELLRPPDGDFLGFDLKFSIRRLPLPDKILTAFVGQLRPRPLRILFMACAPRDQKYLNYEREEEFMFRAIEKAGPNVVIDSGDMGSFEELRQRINEFQPHIVHLTGHGIVRDDGLGYFAFEDEQGKTDLRSSVEIRQQLFAGSSVQCAFISGCQTGKAPPVEALGGICQGLVGDEVPLAIGWAASIADNSATHFAATFYNTLAAGQPVDRALTQARQAIRKLCEEQGDPSWTLPVLYNVTSQRMIFDPRSKPVPPLRKSIVQRPLPGLTEGYAKQFIGRRRELQELLPALREGSLQTVLITGLGGAGKSTLATRIARKLETDDFIPIPVPSSKDNPLSAARLMQICNDAFLAAGQRDAHFTLSDSRLSVNDRLRYIISILNKNRFLLLLDNFEVNIDESTRKILDPELAGFYTYMISNLVGESRAIITSRYRPADVQELPSIAQERTLGDFPESSFIKFLLLEGIVEQRYYKGEIPHDLLSKLYELLGGTPRFLGQVREVLKTIKAEELRSQLEAVTLPSKEKPTLLQQARDQYCEDIFTSRLYGYLNFDSQKALSRVAVYTIPVNLAGMRAVTGEPEEKVHSFTREWQDFAFAYPEHEWVASELWTVYGLLRNWLLAPERLSPDDRKAAHKAAGDFLNEMVENDRTSELGMHPLYVHLEARAQYMSAGDYENAAKITERISGFYRRRGLYSEIQRLNEELLQYYEHPGILAQIAWSYLDRSSYAAAKQWYQRMLDAADGTDKYEAARALHGLATIDLEQGDYETARKKFQTALEINQQIRDRAGEAGTLHNLATIDLEQGDYETARKKFQTALEIRQQIGDRAGEASTWYQLGMLAAKQDRLVDGIKLVAFCFLIEKSIDHADTENAFRVLTGMASQLNYIEEQFNLMLKEVMEAYKKGTIEKVSDFLIFHPSYPTFSSCLQIKLP